MIVIVDYGLGNLGSIQNMLKKVGSGCVISRDPDVIKGAEKLILPGVGAFDAGMGNLREFGLIDLLNEKVLQQRTPVLGICLGMQLMTKSSEEGDLAGLGWINATTRHFSQITSQKVPNMGWIGVRLAKESPLVANLPARARFYFVHSYYVACEDRADVLIDASYGGVYVAGFQRGNIAGMQFHPEKSHSFGMALLANFVRWK